MPRCKYARALNCRALSAGGRLGIRWSISPSPGSWMWSGGGARVYRDYYKLLAAGMALVIYHDLLTDAWALQRVYD